MNATPESKHLCCENNGIDHQVKRLLIAIQILLLRLRICIENSWRIFILMLGVKAKQLATVSWNKVGGGGGREEKTLSSVSRSNRFLF